MKAQLHIIVLGDLLGPTDMENITVSISGEDKDLGSMMITAMMKDERLFPLVAGSIPYVMDLHGWDRELLIKQIRECPGPGRKEEPHESA